MTGAALLAAAVLLAPAPGASAQQGSAVIPAARTTGAAEPVDPLSLPRPSLAVHPTDAAMTLDGRLDEAAWAEADSTEGPFWLSLPRQGLPQEQRTMVRILQRGEELWVGAMMYESEPDRIVTSGLEQDFETMDSDQFGIALDTYHDRSNGYFWAVNPVGALFDTQTFNDARESERAWEGVVETRTATHPLGWTVEMRIPFTTLRYRPSDAPQTWGMNLFRRLRRANEDASWAAVPRQFRPYKFSLAGTLTGLRLSEPGRNLSVKPYALGTTASGTAAAEGSTGDVGIDGKWGITPRLTLDVTLNTDFSQAEVDQEQLSLGRFSVFFPEKRDFFLENEGAFAFQDIMVRYFRTGSSFRNFRLFHSRRIGLSGDRRPVPVLGGVRLTGRAGGFELGLLEMQTRRSELGPAENFAVARVRRTLPGGVTVGGMLVHRQATSGAGERPWNRALGADVSWAPRPDLIVNAYGARTDYPGATGDLTHAMLQVAHRGPLWDASVLAKHTGDGFLPGAGFVSRTGVRRLYATVGAHPQPPVPGVLEVNPYLDLDWFTNLDGVLETREITPGVAVTFLDGGILALEHIDHYERLFEPLSISGGTVPAGAYDFSERTLRYTSSGGRALSGSANVRVGDFFDGTRRSVGGSVQVRPDPRVSLTAAFDRNDLEIGGEDVAADVYSLRASLARDTRTFLLGFVQYNEATEELVSNVRFNLIHAPLSDLFVVFTERRWLGEDAGVDPEGRVRERGVTVKVTRLVGF